MDPASDEMIEAGCRALGLVVGEAGGSIPLAELQARLGWNVVLWERVVGRAVGRWLVVDRDGVASRREGS